MLTVSGLPAAGLVVTVRGRSWAGGSSSERRRSCAADNIALLDLAVSRLPGPCRHRVLVRLDGAGFSHDLLEHIAAGGGVRGRAWEFSVGWSCTDKEMDAIQQLPRGAWTGGIGQDGEPADDTFVADLTGLLDLGTWQKKIPGLRIIVRDEPLHPRYRKRATEREKKLGRRYQLIATNTRHGQIAWLDARHRSHVHVENNVKQAKDLGLNRWPSRHWAINVAWTQIVALAANLLACFPPPGITRWRATRRRPEAVALPALPPARPPDPRPAQTMAPPPCRLALDHRPDQRLAGSQGPASTDLTRTPTTRRPGKTRPDRGTRRPRCDDRTPNLPANKETMIKNRKPRSRIGDCHAGEKSRPVAGASSQCNWYCIRGEYLAGRIFLATHVSAGCQWPLR